MPYANTIEKVKSYREKPRPVTPRPREPNGKPQRASRAERREDVQACAVKQPHRKGLPKTWRDDDGKEHPLHPEDPRAGYALGRLFLARQINQAQLHTGDKIGERIKAYIAIRTPGGMGYGAQDLNRSGGGGGEGAEMTDRAIARIRENMAEITKALEGTSSSAECLEALVMTCAMDEDVRRHDVLGYLREGINVVQRVWERAKS